jgi:hypothetical protein
MATSKNIYTILRNIDFDGTAKYFEQRIQMTNAEFEFNVKEHLFTFAQKFYEEGLNNHEEILESCMLENEHLSFELNKLMINLKEFNRWLDDYKKTCKRCEDLLKKGEKLTSFEEQYLQAKQTILGQFEFALKQNDLKL